MIQHILFNYIFINIDISYFDIYFSLNNVEEKYPRIDSSELSDSIEASEIGKCYLVYFCYTDKITVNKHHR